MSGPGQGMAAEGSYGDYVGGGYQPPMNQKPMQPMQPMQQPMQPMQQPMDNMGSMGGPGMDMGPMGGPGMSPGPMPGVDFGKQMRELFKNADQYCDNKQGFVDACKAKASESMQAAFSDEIIGKKCEFGSKQAGLGMARFCRDTTRGKEQCVKQSERAIQFAQQSLDKCRDFASSENMKEVMLRKATEMCKMKWIDEQTQNLDAVGFDQRFYDPLQRMRMTSGYIVDDYKPWVEGEQSKIIDVASEVQELSEEENQRGMGYAVSKFFGGQVKQEKEDAARLEAQVTQLENTIENLKTITENLEDSTSQTALMAVITDLEKQKEDVASQVEAKRNGAAGLMSIFGSGQ